MEEIKPKIFTEDKHIINWQRKLMPWMIAAPSLLILLFIGLATLQLRTFETHIYQSDSLRVSKTLPNPEKMNVDSTVNNNLGYLKLYTLTKMEEYSINRRYNQAGEILVSGIYTKYLGFFTGMILAIVGSVFIISKLREDASNLEGSVDDHVKLKLISSSPGIIFAVLGTLLMLTTILKPVESNVVDSPLFLNYQTILPDRPNTDNTALNDLDQPESSRHIDTSKLKDATP